MDISIYTCIISADNFQDSVQYAFHVVTVMSIATKASTITEQGTHVHREDLWYVVTALYSSGYNT